MRRERYAHAFTLFLYSIGVAINGYQANFPRLTAELVGNRRLDLKLVSDSIS